MAGLVPSCLPKASLTQDTLHSAAEIGELHFEKKMFLLQLENVYTTQLLERLN